MKPLLSIQNIHKSFKDKHVLKGVDLELYPGEILGLIGRSGCGKSTLIKILVGYYEADSGKIEFVGKDITKRFDIVKSLVGYTTQENSFYEKLTVYENMYYYSNLYNVPLRERKKRIHALLESVKLNQSKNVLSGDISGGMKRRLDFAISLLHNPELVILDEPTTGLDPVLVDNFWKIVTDIVKEKKITVLVSSHLLSEIKKYCTKAAVMHNGRIDKMIDISDSTDLEKEFRKITE